MFSDYESILQFVKVARNLLEYAHILDWRQVVYIAGYLVVLDMIVLERTILHVQLFRQIDYKTESRFK